MTTAAAFLDHDGRIAIGADYLVTSATTCRISTKIHRVGPLLVVPSGPAILGRLLAERAERNDLSTLDSLTDDIFASLRERGSGKQDENGDHWYNASFLAICPGHRLPGPWEACIDASCLFPTEGYAAIGSGRSIATGVLHAARARQWSAADAVRAALEAANAHDPYTEGMEVLTFDPFVESAEDADPSPEVSDRPLDPVPRARMEAALLHRLWGKAHATADYDKAEWTALQALQDGHDPSEALKRLREPLRLPTVETDP